MPFFNVLYVWLYEREESLKLRTRSKTVSMAFVGIPLHPQNVFLWLFLAVRELITASNGLRNRGCRPLFRRLSRTAPVVSRRCRSACIQQSRNYLRRDRGSRAPYRVGRALLP